jgi:hypothetical protein
MKKEQIPRLITASVLKLLARSRNAMMQAKLIKAVIGCVSGAGFTIGNANAQPTVTWGAPVTISGTSDVSTAGIYFGSWAPYDGSAKNYSVNGLTFQGFSDLPNLRPGATLA